MVIVSMIFLVRISSSAEGIPNRGSTSTTLTSTFTTMCFRVCIDGRSISARPSLAFGEFQTIMEREIRNLDDHGVDIYHLQDMCASVRT